MPQEGTQPGVGCAERCLGTAWLAEIQEHSLSCDGDGCPGDKGQVLAFSFLSWDPSTLFWAVVPIPEKRTRRTLTRTAWWKAQFWKVGAKKDTESRRLTAWMGALSTGKCTKEQAATLPPAFPVSTLLICWQRTPSRLKYVFMGGRWRRAYSEGGYWILNSRTAGWKSFYSQAKAKSKEHSKRYYCRAKCQQSWAGVSRLETGTYVMQLCLILDFSVILWCHAFLGQYSLLQRENLLMLQATKDSFLIIQ